ALIYGSRLWEVTASAQHGAAPPSIKTSPLPAFPAAAPWLQSILRQTFRTNGPLPATVLIAVSEISSLHTPHHQPQPMPAARSSTITPAARSTRPAMPETCGPTSGTLKSPEQPIHLLPRSRPRRASMPRAFSATHRTVSVSVPHPTGRITWL